MSNSGKVKCTCGWSWNKSDSSAKDMYICHECGRDNSNNMKDGGWLDNYNDYSVSAPEGFEGDGYSNVGRNSSPAWGGQFQEGGEIPIAQSGNATRQDSIALYNNAIQKEKYYKNNKNYYIRPGYDDNGYGMNFKNDELRKNLVNEIKKRDARAIYFPDSTHDMGKQLKNAKDRTKQVTQNVYSAPDFIDNKVDYYYNPKAPPVFISDKIRPQGSRTYHSDSNADSTNIPYYDPLAVKPFDLLSDKEKQQRVKQYGTKGVPKSYLDKKKISVKTSAKTSVQTPKETYNTPQVQSIENNLHPAGLVYPDNNIEADVDIHNRARIPKYYDVIDKVNQNFGGSESKYKYYPENGDLPNVAPSPYNTRTVTPHYQMGGSVYPVNYVPEAQTGGSFPGATGFSYARTGSIPSKGPRRNQTDVTDASAQNGKEMQYYQQGLDWQPKTISKNGGWLDGYDVAQGGTNLPSVRDLITDTMNRKIQARKGKGKETVVTKKDNTKTVTPKVDTTKPLTKKQVEARRLLEGLKQNIAADEETGLQERKAQAFKSMQEFYKSPLGSPGYLTPGGMAVGALQGAFKMPGHIAEGDTWGVVGDAAMMLPFAKPAVTTLGRALGTESGLLSNAYKLNPNSGKLGRYNRIVGNNAIEDLNASGLVRAGNKGGRNNMTLHNVSFNRTTPYPSFGEGVPAADNVYAQSIVNQGNKPYIISTNREFAPSTLGRHGKGSTMFPIDDTGKYLESFPASEVNVFEATKPHWLQGYKEVPKQNNVQPSFIKQDLSEGNNIKYSFTDKQGNNIGTFSGTKSPKGIYVNGIEVNPEFRRQGVASDIYKNIARELQSKNEGTLFSRSGQHQFTAKDELGRSVAPANKLWENLVNKGEAEKFVEGMSHSYKMKPLKQGGIIKDDRGQWDHPGEITEIGSNQITMEGVPYDVLGVSDTGDTKLMKPGKNYKFKGKNVTEYPMAQDGTLIPSGKLMKKEMEQKHSLKELIAMMKAKEVPEIFPTAKVDPIWNQGIPASEIKIQDKRKVNATSGKPINPNKDLVSGNYNQDTIKRIVIAANDYGVDPYTALSIGLQETQLGKTDSNIGHVIGGHDISNDDRKFPNRINSPEEDLVRILKYKQEHARKLGIKGEAGEIQSYNGLGKIYPQTEQHYHGFKMKQIYGVDVPKTGIDMKQNPLYGKRIIDLRDNVLRQNPNLVEYINTIVNPFTGKIENKNKNIITFKDGGLIKKSSQKAKNGKELKKLDQLTNFTNYNKPQPGGWLDNL